MSDKPDPANALANRVNQTLGDELVKLKLVSLEVKEKAVPILKQYLLKGEVKRSSLLKILCWDMSELEEKEVLDHLIEEHTLGYCNLANYEVQRDRLPMFRANECWATMSIPLDFMEGVFFVATCHYLSSAVKEHWEKRLNRDIVWMISDLSGMTMCLEKIEKMEAREQEEEEERKKQRRTRSPFGKSTRNPFKEVEEESVAADGGEEGWG